MNDMNKDPKTIIRVILLQILLCLLFSACGKQQESSAATEGSTGYAHSINSTDCDRNFAMGSGKYAVCATEDSVYFVADPVRGSGAQMWFSDNKTGLTMPLCGKADCSHSDSTCNSYFAGRFFCLSAYDGKLFWLGRDPLGVFHMYSCEPDGNDREEYAIENNELLQSITSGMTAFIHRGYAYYYGECSVVKNGEPSMESALVRCPVRGGTAETVAHASENGAVFATQACEDSIYLVCTKYRGDDRYEIEITQIDSTTLDKKSLYRGESCCVNNIYVVENGVFLSCVDANKLYFFDYAEQKITVPFAIDPEDVYLRQLYFGDDRIVATQHSDSYDLLITDFNGNVLMKKTYSLEISKQMKENSMYIAMLMGIDQNNVYIYFKPMSKGAFSGLMRFPLDGSDPVVLWSEN